MVGDTHLDWGVAPDLTDNEKPLEYAMVMPWFTNISNNNVSFHRKEVSRQRKQKWVFKSTQFDRFERLVKMCGNKLGTDTTIHVFGRLGRETGLKEFSALIRLCIDRAKKAEDEDALLEQNYNAYQLFTTMRDQGFPIKEETYGPFLMYLIDMGMVKEFFFFGDVIKNDNPDSLSRLAYYEMLLWISVGDEDKIQELCNSITDIDDTDMSIFQESYLVALCEGNRQKEVLLLLETIDITKVSSPNRVASIFKSLGKLSLESFAKKFIVQLKTVDIGAVDVSNFVYTYAVSMPKLSVEEIVLKFKNLHEELEVNPSRVPYEKLIKFSCASLKVHVALVIVDWMLEAKLTIPIETFHLILDACLESCEYNLVHRIYSAMRSHELKPNNETCRLLITLWVRMKDFDSAYHMIKRLKKMNLVPTASIYNAIMVGHFREKNFQGGMMVLKQMEDADVKPDSQTFSYIINNCSCVEDINKYYEELKSSGTQATKHIFLALINAYAACGQFEKAKQVILDEGVPVKSLNEIKSGLVSALASNGQMSDALNIYEEIKQVKADLKPKAILKLIEHLQSEGELDRLLLLLEQLNDPDHWADGCFRVVSYCVQHKHLSSAVDLLKQLKDKCCNSKVVKEVILDEVFCRVAEVGPTDVQFGLDLLQAIKKDVGLVPSRTNLDFLLSACVSAKDRKSSLLVWNEYQTAGLPYNVLSFVRMYQALLASGDHKAANVILDQIPNDDPHVSSVVEACQKRYPESTSKGSKKKKKKKAGKNSR